MKDELISSDDIYLQDVVCSVVSNNINKEDIDLYNIICENVTISNLNTTIKILNLIKINKLALQQ